MKHILIFLLFVSTLRSQESAEFYIGEGLSLGLIAADWNQTRWIAGKNWTTYHDQKGKLNHYEANVILGKRPSVKKVDVYMASVMILHAAVAKKLNRPWRYALWGVTIAIQTKVILNNHKHGLKVF